MDVPGAAGGRPQCTPEPGRGGGGCARLHSLLQGHRVLGTKGTHGTAFCAPTCDLQELRQVQTSLAVIFLFAWGFGFTVVAPESFCSSHPAFPYLPLLKSKAPQNKAMINIAFSGAGHVWHCCSPRSARYSLCVLGQVVIIPECIL